MTAAAYAISQVLSTADRTRLESGELALSYYTPLSALGLSIATAILYAGANINFASSKTPFLDAVKRAKTAAAVYMPAAQAKELAKTLDLQHDQSSSPLLKRQLLPSKLAAMRQGTLGRQGPIWDRSLSALRSSNGTDSLRAIVTFVTNPAEVLTQTELDHLRIYLGASIVQSLTHYMHPAPLTSSHPADFQVLPLAHSTGMAHVGPPAANVQLKVLMNSDDENQYEGDLVVGGPSLARISELVSPSKTSEDDWIVQGSEQWFRTGLKAKIERNGVVWLQQ